MCQGITRGRIQSEPNEWVHKPKCLLDFGKSNALCSPCLQDNIATDSSRGSYFRGFYQHLLPACALLLEFYKPICNASLAEKHVPLENHISEIHSLKACAPIIAPLRSQALSVDKHYSGAKYVSRTTILLPKELFPTSPKDKGPWGQCISFHRQNSPRDV